MFKLTDRTWIWILFGVGFFARLIYFLEYRSMIEFAQPTVDALYHHLMAVSIADGALTASEPFFRAPFYSYFLGFIYWITSDSIGAARFIQLVIGTATAPLVFLISREACSRRVALIASAMVLLCQDLVYFETELLLESILVTLILLSFYTMLKFIKTGHMAALLTSALTAGFAVITRPNAIVLLIPLIWLVWTASNKRPSVRRGRALAVLAVTSLIPLSLVLAHNLTRTQPAFTLATQGGVNFYIGNNEAADGVSAVMPGELGFNWQYQDVAFLAEQSRRRELTPSEVSSYYYSRGVSEIAETPGRWIKLLVKKAYLLFSGEDISNNRNLSYFKGQFFVLKLLPLGMWFLGPLGVISLVFWRRSSGPLRAMQIFVLLYAATFILFFVNSRFRLPLLPPLAIMAASSLVYCWDLIRSRNWTPALFTIMITAVLLICLNLNLYGMQFDNRKQALFTRGNLQLRAGSVDEALDTYRKAAQLPGDLKDLHLNMGVAFLKKASYDSAWKYLLIEDSLSQGSAEALSNLAYLYRQTRQYDDAIASAKLALKEKPYLQDARLNLWYAWRESGKPESVLVAADSLSRERALTDKEKFIRAVSAADAGRFDEAAGDLKKLLESPDFDDVQPRYAEAASATQGTLGPPVSRGHIYYNLGYAMAGMGRIDSAIVLFHRAVEAEETLQEAWINLGTAYLNKRQFDDAVSAYRNALRIGPESEVLLYNLAIALLSRGDNVEGENYLRQTLELDPDFAPARALLQRLQQSP